MGFFSRQHIILFNLGFVIYNVAIKHFKNACFIST